MALVLDRRAPLVSGLFYVLSVVWALFVTKEGGGDRGVLVAGASLVIASALLLLAAGWKRARALVLRGVPAGWREALPPG
jgi:hypothetical protein